ncbi:MAG: beta-N-acetylglucosaminidase domain-containing protein [Bacteroidales bacterium]|nr:MAG: beta-N-acetylglucosaminidase domain-containing protein [Bacteroidales bacterium]
MKSLNLIIIWLVAFGFLLSCKQPKKDIPVPVSWSSNDPLTIPFRIRLQKFQRANLIENSSFELGKTFVVDTAGSTFRVDGWQKVGDNVEWVNIVLDTIYNANEAVDSLHSIKIHRSSIDETDEEGEGIISDYIRVIPGNYSLSFYIKLEDICSSKERLGTRLHDAVNIIVYYYDKNKIPVSSRLYLPQKDIYINNSFKGFSFSNYWHIDKFGWARVYGKSHNYNCPEGDIPDEARYVKIYLGLKGIGTMWIDNVDFRYTKSNFTNLERMKYLTDTLFSKHEFIIPAPKEIKKYESIIYYEPGTDNKNLPVILVPDNISVETGNAAQLIKNKMENLFKSLMDSAKNDIGIKILTRLPDKDINSSRLIFSIGKNNLYRRFREILPINDIKNKAQGYFIYTNSDISNLIFLAGNNPAGDYYAATTAIQLFDNKKFIFHNAKVIDYPDFENRYFNLSAYNRISDVQNNISYIDELTGYKINGAYISSDWNMDSVIYRQILTGISSKHTNHDIFNFRILLAPPEFFNYMAGNDDLIEENRQINISSINQDKLLSICSTGFNNGALGILYVPCFITPLKTGLCQKGQSDNHLNISGRLTRNLSAISNIVNNEYAGMDIGLLPPWYNNEIIDGSRGTTEFLLKRITSGFHDNISYFWTGNSFHSLKTDNADLERIEYFLKQIPVYWDNSILTGKRNMNVNDYYSHYPGKVKLLNLFEPYNDDNIDNILGSINRDQIFFNSHVTSELDLIKFATVADFSWNTRSYDPDLSLWKVLLSRYGLEATKLLIIINDDYFSLKEIILNLKSAKPVQKLVRKGENIIDDLNTELEKLASILGESHPLTDELKYMVEDITREYNELSNELNNNLGNLQSIENID